MDQEILLNKKTLGSRFLSKINPFSKDVLNEFKDNLRDFLRSVFVAYFIVVVLGMKDRGHNIEIEGFKKIVQFTKNQSIYEGIL